MQKLNSRRSIYNEIYAEFLRSGCRFWTDSRKVSAEKQSDMHGKNSINHNNSNWGGVFFAISGERFDANDFAVEALRHGASMAVVDRRDLADLGDNRIVVVEDVLEAMSQVAILHRDRMQFEVIALTGSNGKTTTKELLVRALSTKYRVAATSGNFNNHIGVPITILSVDLKSTDILVVEMGANHQFEIENLCRIAKPTMGLVTNVGVAHLEGFGSKECVEKTKGELYDYLIGHGGVIVYNAQDETLSRMMAERVRLDSDRIIGYNLAELGVSNPSIDAEGMLLFDYKGHGVKTNIVGLYNIRNIGAVTAISEYLGLDMDRVIESMAEYTSNNNRSQKVVTSRDNIVILDAYNANPSSMEVALENFARLAQSIIAKRGESNRRLILVLGDMKELGQESVMIHRHIIEYAVSLFDKNPHNGDNARDAKIWLVGECMTKAIGGGLSDLHEQSRCVTFEDVEMLKNYISSMDESDRNNNLMLIKGSRSMKLEQIMDVL